MARVAVIGNINMDRILRVDSFPLEGETKAASSYKLLPGGKGANQAVAASLLGAEVRLIGMVGYDIYGEKALQNLKSKGVNTDFVMRSHEPTGMAFVMSREDGANSIVSYRGANLTLSPKDIDLAREVIEWCDILLLQLGVPVETVSHAIDTAEKMGKEIFLDPTPFTGALPENVGKVSFLSPNEVEMRLITGFEDRRAYRKLHESGVDTVVHKAGSEGCYISFKGEVERVEALNGIEVIDTTGAGDTFSGAFAVSWASGSSLRQAAVFANAAAAISTTKIGAQEAMPTIGQITKFIRKAAI